MTKNTYQVVLPFVRRVSSSVALKTFLRVQSPCKEKQIEKENFIERAELGKNENYGGIQNVYRATTYEQVLSK